MTTTCFICGLKISNAEGYALSILNIGNGDQNEAALICKEYHKRKMERQTKRAFDIDFMKDKLAELDNRVTQLERNSFPIPPRSIPATWSFNKNGHLEGCLCIRCSDLK